LKARSSGRERLDVVLSRRASVESRERARALILAGRVRIAGETERRPGRLVEPEASLELAEGPRFVSRGGDKLDPVLDAFGIQVAGRVAADVGASTGGFTDVLLQRGAVRVYAIDVGRGLIHWRLRQDPRVVLMERVNARDVEAFPEPVSLATVDVSFIGLEKVLPALRRAAPAAEVVALFKPQFQVERAAVGKGGVVRDGAAIERALRWFREWAPAGGYAVQAEADSPLPGQRGNRERFLHLLPVAS
jgi:23S rRNA (cytidine1920-2'-O)/16S rRNA (cytidine1409-2'-O)-methyltransferase